MSDNQAQRFLEYILANPDEDAPRLVFADWLEEQGENDRAEFIRVQIERARLPKWDARQIRLRLRERALLEEHGRKWKQALPRIRGIAWEECRRGFVATATFSSFAVLRANASACWAAAPIEVVSVPWPRGGEPLDRITPIAGLRELSLTQMPGDSREVDQLAEAPFFSTLRAVNIRGGSLETEGFRRFLASPHLGNLTALRVPSNSIGSGGVRALFHAASLTSLEELDLSERDNYDRYGETPIIEAVDVGALATWTGMDRLRSLTLSGNSVGREGLRALLRSQRATGLKELVIRDTGLNALAMQEFGAARPELQLDVLDVGENLLKDLGAAELANAPCLRALKVLDVDSCKITSSGARKLARAPFLNTLRLLNVSHNRLGPEGLHSLLAQPPQELHTLEIINNDLGDEGVAHLAGSPASDTLRELNLARNGLGFHAVNALANSPHLQQLLILRLHPNPIDKLAEVALRSSPLGKRLVVLEQGSYVCDDEISF